MEARIQRVTAVGAAGVATLGAYLALGVPQAEPGSTPRCFGKPATIVRGNGDNPNIDGTPQRDVIVAGNGENHVDGNQGADLICGGKDGDTLVGGAGNDKLTSGASIDYIAGKKGDDLAIAGRGADEVNAVAGSAVGDQDRVRGKGGQDYLSVADGQGNDSVGGGPAFDECPADGGDDKNCEL